MYQNVLQDTNLLSRLMEIDRDLAAMAQERGCQACGGVLHRADYPRRPRGPWELGREFRRRLSFCCAVEGCRRRTTPPSVFFLGRKVYPGAVVVLVAAMTQGPTRSRMTEIREVWGVGVRTVKRWRAWWTESFVRSPFWRACRARFSGRVREDALPFSLVEAFGVSAGVDRLVALLRWLSPMSHREGLSGRAL